MQQCNCSNTQRYIGCDGPVCIICGEDWPEDCEENESSEDTLENLKAENEHMKSLINAHDLKRPNKPVAVLGIVAWGNLTSDKQLNLENKWSAEWREWQQDLEALQYGMRKTLDALLQHRLTLIMNKDKELA